MCPWSLQKLFAGRFAGYILPVNSRVKCFTPYACVASPSSAIPEYHDAAFGRRKCIPSHPKKQWRVAGIIRGAKERAGEMQERYTFLASLYEVMEGNGVAISDDTRTAANMIVKVHINFLG